MGDLTAYVWDGACWRWRSSQAFWERLFGFNWDGFDWDFDVLLHGTPEGPDPSHASHLQAVAPKYQQVAAEAAAYVGQEYRQAEYVRLKRKDLTRATNVVWFGFGVPASSERPDEFHVALELNGDGDGIWQVWFEIDGQAKTWRPRRLERGI